MADERKFTSDPYDHHDRLPKDVLTTAQDPDSFRDPLEVQLEKSRSLNSGAEKKSSKK
jgi:hypothetical protein